MRMHTQRTLDEVLADVIAKAPRADAAPLADPSGPKVDAAAHRDEPAAMATPATASSSAQDPERDQNPQHIDQRLPPAPGSGPRSFGHTWQPLEATFDYGVGEIMARSDGTRLNDRTKAAFARARLDTGTGAALHADWWRSDSDLFAGQFLNDGVAPRPSNGELGGVDLFPHVRFDHRDEDFRMPLRLGLFADWQQLDHQTARVEREWLSFGPRVLIEPTWTMARGERGRLDLFARVGGDVGLAWFSEEFRNGDDKDTTLRWSGEVGGGLRGAYGSWHAELGYRLQHTMFGETQGSLFGAPGRTELQRQQVFFGVGYTY